MSIFATALPAKPAKTSESLKVSVFFAAVLTVMAVAQLFTFEAFLPYVQSLGLPMGETWAYSLAPLIIIAEVFAIPFLLRMRLSPAFRFFSMFLSWMVILFWLFISLWLALGNANVDTVGFLGTVIDLTPGYWAVFISLALGILAAWSSWGLWPGKRRNR
jgi:hypothetical protein